jgi:putative peptide zinc metalloprotease protein
MMTVFAAGSMVCWPLYRLCKNIYRRGRLPDMKTSRVVVTAAVVAAILLVIVLVPLPISRILQTGVVQLDPSRSHPVPMRSPGTMEFPLVFDGQPVHTGDLLGHLSNPLLVQELKDLEAEKDTNTKKYANLESQRKLAERETDPEKRKEAQRSLDLQMSKVDVEIKRLTSDIAAKRREVEYLEFRAPRNGQVYNLPRKEQVGKQFEPEQEQESYFCTVGEPGDLVVLVPVTNTEFKLLQEDLEAAAAENKSLDVTVRVKGLVEETFHGKVLPLPEEVAREGDVPPQLTTRHGGPLAVKPGTRPGIYVPQNQQYLISIKIENPPSYIAPGTLAQVKIHCRWRTTRWWIWRKVTDLFDLPLW